MSKTPVPPPSAEPRQPLREAHAIFSALEKLSTAQRVQTLEGAIAFYDLKLADGRLRA